tara:strand:- start:285 stop:506 length:222 start_codon:yes stop_codon:yes gene_type:complete
MSNLTERCEQRKAEAQALADKYNALDTEEKKIANEKAQLLAEFNVKNAQYAELFEQVQEESNVESEEEATVDG